MTRNELKILQERTSKAVKIDKEIVKIEAQIKNLWEDAKSVQINFDKDKVDYAWQTSKEHNPELVNEILYIINIQLRKKIDALEKELLEL